MVAVAACGWRLPVGGGRLWMVAACGWWPPVDGGLEGTFYFLLHSPQFSNI